MGERKIVSVPSAGAPIRTVGGKFLVRDRLILPLIEGGGCQDGHLRFPRLMDDAVLVQRSKLGDAVIPQM